MRKESSWLFDRNLNIHDIVEFLLSNNKGLLVLYGNALNGRSSIVHKAIKIVMAHRIGIYDEGFPCEVKLENLGFSSVV